MGTEEIYIVPSVDFKIYFYLFNLSDQDGFWTC